MPTFQQLNPFSKREGYDRTTILTHKILSIVSWLLVVISSFYYTFSAPQDGELAFRWTIWGVNQAYPTAFALSSIITSIYWIVLFVLQIGYVWHLFSDNSEYVTSAAAVGSHFIFNNILQFAWLMLFVRGYFIWSELILIINFFNLSLLYFRHNTYARFIHIPVVSGPLAWSFVALYWNGAIAVNATGLAARILANIAIWGVLVYGLFFLVTFKDYTMGFALSILSASLGVHQFLRQVLALQWIFAFTIMATLFIATLVIAVPGIFGKDLSIRKDTRVLDEDRERAPLLDDN